LSVTAALNGPMPPASPTPPVDYRTTAVRPGWGDLPAALRGVIEERLGGRVVSVSTAGGGFTRGFAAVVTSSSGARAFVKAADLTSQRHLADGYYHEVLVTLALPAGVPAPRPRWTATAADWYAVCLDPVDGAMPTLPWQPASLAAALDAWSTAAASLRTPPADLAALHLPRLADLVRSDLSCWSLGSSHPHLPELIALESALPSLVDGPGLTHGDLRLDNILIDRSGAAWICDWNWLCRGAPWFDTAALLVTAYASGLNADRLFAHHPTAAGAPPDALDAALAALSGYWLTQASLGSTSLGSADPSPALRTHQRFSGETALAWLATRRSWPAQAPPKC
jgi:aminoglycoside phosphotransferase (APT) family kinase protein